MDTPTTRFIAFIAILLTILGATFTFAGKIGSLEEKIKINDKEITTLRGTVLSKADIANLSNIISEMKNDIRNLQDKVEQLRLCVTKIEAIHQQQRTQDRQDRSDGKQ